MAVVLGVAEHSVAARRRARSLSVSTSRATAATEPLSTGALLV
jgi:hypothetical protein